MRFVPYILKTLWRHRARTVLTASGSAAALFVCCFVGAVQEGIDDALRGGPVQTNTRPKGIFQAKSLGDLTQLIEMARYLAYACVGLVLTMVATTTVMSVQDRVKEHAVLQTIGFSGPRVFSLVLVESVVLGVVGGILGVGAAMLVLKTTGLAVAAEAVTVAFMPSFRLACAEIVAAFAAGLLAGLVPAFHAARADIVPALRQA